MPADLHCHTKISDGSVSIEELLQLAKRKGLKTVAVTDHDTFAGAIRAKVYGKRNEIEVIPGAEFSTADTETGKRAHILCYFCSNTDRLEGLCKHTSDARRRASLVMLQKVIRLYPVTAEMIMRRAQGSTNIYKQHVMHALIDAGCTDEFYGPVYRKLFDRKVGLAYSAVHYPDTRDVIKRIHDAGGVTVFAHPCLYDGFPLLEKLASEGLLDGVEVSHPCNKEDDEEKARAIAQKYHLAMTGGSDFHGMYTNHRTEVGACLTEDDQIELLKKRAAALRK
ncbi:PHP domain-containing protein [Caproicibacterium sp. NSD3]